MRPIWIIPCLAAIAAESALAQSPTSRPAGEIEALIRRVMASEDKDAIVELGRSGVQVAVAIERALGQSKPPDQARIAALVALLGDANWRKREEATDELARMGPSAAPVLAAMLPQQTDPEVRTRLANILKCLKGSEQARDALATVLMAAYGAHFDDLFPGHMEQLIKDPHDQAASVFLCYAPFDKVTAAMKDRPREDALRYLLMVLHAGPWDQRKHQERLKDFTAKEVLDMAARTYWPVETEPVQLDGAYGWTTRAGKVEGAVATDVIRMSVVKPTDEKSGWLHLNHWGKWTYIFHSERNYFNQDVVAVVESARTAPLPFGCGRPQEAWTRVDTVRGVPASVRIPTVNISSNELMDLHLAGSPYRWSAVLMQEDVQKRLQFRENKYPVPKITFPPTTKPAGSPR